jgi:trans-aconitate 2-methyltransferase
MSAVRNWDGKSYDRISAPMEALGRGVLARLELSGDELALDVGCGSGRITEALLERLPFGKVIAVDMSASMIDAARERLAWACEEPGARLELRLADVLELELEEPADAVLSTATFHWIADHEPLFRRLRALLRSGGQLAAQCGGEGNIDGLRGRARVVQERAPYAQHFSGWRPPWNYAGAELTRERLLRAGFQSANCWLEPTPVTPEYPREFLSMIVLGPHVQQLPSELREPYMDEVMAELGEPLVADYVRLNIDATA